MRKVSGSSEEAKVGRDRSGDENYPLDSVGRDRSEDENYSLDSEGEWNKRGGNLKADEDEAEESDHPHYGYQYGYEYNYGYSAHAYEYEDGAEVWGNKSAAVAPIPLERMHLWSCPELKP